MLRLSRVAGRVLGAGRYPPRHKLHTVRFRRLARNLRTLVELSDDASDKLKGEWILDRSYVAAFVARSLDRAREIVFDSTVLAGDPSPELHARLDAVRVDLGGLGARPPAGPPASAAGEERGGGADLEEPEYRLLQAAIQRLALDGSTTPGPGSSPVNPPLAEVVEAAHERALRALQGLRSESWGRRAGRPVVGSGFPGPIRIVDVGRGVAPSGGRGRRRPVEWGRIRSAPLRALLGMAPSRKESWGRAEALAVVTEENATVDIGWPGGTLLIDACLGEHAAANVIYCALRVDSSRSTEAMGMLTDGEGFRRVNVGPGVTAWQAGRGHDECRQVLGRLGSALGALLREPVEAVKPNDPRRG